jgi:predicted amidohydrolase
MIKNNIKDFKIGVLICYDIEFPEPARTLVLEGAELLIVPTALVGAFNAL